MGFLAWDFVGFLYARRFDFWGDVQRKKRPLSQNMSLHMMRTGASGRTVTNRRNKKILRRAHCFWLRLLRRKRGMSLQVGQRKKAEPFCGDSLSTE